MIEPIAGMDPTLPYSVAPPAGPAPEPSSEAAPTGPKEFKLFGEKGFSFFDLLDIINPLQHIPVISTIYRKITGDELSPGARIAGATLFGGPIGAAIAMVDTAVEHESGRDMGGNVMAALIGDDKPIPAGGTAVASAGAGTASSALGFAGSAAKPSAFVGAALPDLGALNGFATAAGTRATAVEPIKLDPRVAIEPWQAPAAEQVVAETTAPAMPSYISAKPVKLRASQATVEAAMLQVEAMRAQQSTLAATETKDDVTTIAAADPQGAWRRVKPPASDIPIGAAQSLSRAATRAYAKSMMPATPSPANTNVAPEPARTAATAQNDWIVDSMAAAMAKYEAGRRLQSATAQPMQAVSR